ncbi:uncharacterized protein LOC129939484 [Eupeodes corollae]|uniref:uncharacterized protein LOC129939484 n=1 Tax=Eupeodes corollae TaxID=290404 RepID=UPI00248F6647|nr:uncharacterized protein LOC129939484 [Eupeodes corollae]
MLIRMFVGNIILSVLLLAGVSLCTAEEDGYDYSKPLVGFSDGLNSFGSQTIYTKPKEYIVAATTPKPAAVYTVKPQTSINQGFGQYKAPIVTKPQTSYGGSSSFAQSSTSFSRPVSYGQGFGQSSFTSGSGQYVSGQYKTPVVTSKPQTNFGAYQGFGQSVSTLGSGQYKAPVVSVTSKPQTNFGAYQGFGQSVSTLGSGQYKAPVVSVTSKPQTSFGSFQGFGQSNINQGQYQSSIATKFKPSFGGFQSYKPQVSVVKPTYVQPITVRPISVKPVTLQPVSYQTVKPIIAKPIYAKPIVVKPVTVQPVVAQPIPVQPVQVSQAVLLKPQSVKPLSGFGSFQGLGFSKPFGGFGNKINQQPLKTVSVATSKIGQYQNAQYQAPSTGYTQTTSTFSQKPLTSFTNIGPSYLPPSKPLSAITVQPTLKPAVVQYNIQGSSSTVAPAVLTVTSTPRPAVITAKPQTSFNTFQGFGQTISKPAVVQYQKPIVVTTAKPVYKQPVVQYQKPLVSAPIKTQTFQSFGQTSYQKPAVSQTYFTQSSTAKPGLSYLPPKAEVSLLQPTSERYTSTPTTIKPIIVTSKPAVSTLNTYGQQSAAQYSVKPLAITPKPQVSVSSFAQSVYQKPAISTVNTYGQQSAIKYTNTPTTFKPITKPQTAFSGFGQSIYQKPAISTFNTYGQQSAIKYTNTPTTFKPITVTTKPQTAYNTFGQQTAIKYTNTPQTAFSGYGQSVYQKPAISTFNTYGQQSAIKYTNTPTTSKPLTVTAKPQTAFSGYGQSVYQKPAISTFNTYGQQSAIKYTSAPTTLKPIISVTAKPQTAFSGYKQSVYQKPAISTFNTYGQQSAIKYTNTPTTLKPIITVTAKPQTAFSGYGQSVYQKPAISTFNTYGQQSAIKYTSTPTTLKPIISVTAKPQTAFSGYGQSVYQKPAISTFNTYGQQSAIKYTSTPTTLKPIITVTAKPQTAFTGFEQSVYQKPAISTLSTYGQQSAIKYTNTPTTVKPLAVYQAPIIVSTTAKPQEYIVSSTLAPSSITLSPDSLTYLPPKGAELPLNAASASGAVSESFFEFPSATANQVVDVAQEQKVGGFGELSTIRNQRSSSEAQEQKVEGIDLRSNKLTETNNGQEEEEEISSGNIDKVDSSSAPAHHRTTRDTYSSQGYQDEYTPPIGYLSYQGNPITSQQFGGVQPNSYQGIPYQQIVQAQTSLGLEGQQTFAPQQSFQDGQYQGSNNGYGIQNQDPYNFEGQYGYISSVEDQQQQIPQQNYEAAASYTDTVNTQIPDDSSVQDPKPLNREEQQARQVEEKPENNFQNLQPGSYIGPHVNKNSDQEYNVFDYDQFSTNPEDADTDADV